jgi:gliding motility-associated-like protein
LTLEDYILINPIEKADFRVEPEEISIESISNLGIINNVSNDSYLRWALCDTIFWENVYTPNIVDSIFDTGFYHLKMYTINEFGCMDSLEKTFIVTPVYNFYIPSAFSPNENGINDTFGPVGKYFDMQSYELKIYNRWGQVVFQTHDFFQHWDGKMTNGLRAPMGTYAYIIKLADMDGNNKLIRGSVSLLL